MKKGPSDIVKKLPKDSVENLKEAVRKVKLIENKIEKRITYIVQKLNELFDKKDCGWYFYNECDDCGQEGLLLECFEKDIFQLNFEGVNYSEDYELILEDGEIWGMQYKYIPARWLFEDFEQEIIDGRKKYLENQTEEIQKEEKEENEYSKKQLDKVSKILSNGKSSFSKKKKLIVDLLTKKE